MFGFATPICVPTVTSTCSTDCEKQGCRSDHCMTADGASAHWISERVARRLTAILAADVAGYSHLMGADEEGMLAQLKAHRRALVDPKNHRAPWPDREDHRGRHAGRVRQRGGPLALCRRGPTRFPVVRLCSRPRNSRLEARNLRGPPAQFLEFRLMATDCGQM